MDLEQATCSTNWIVNTNSLVKIIYLSSIALHLFSPLQLFIDSFSLHSGEWFNISIANKIGYNDKEWDGMGWVAFIVDHQPFINLFIPRSNKTIKQ